MTDLPVSLAPLLRRLTRRIALGQFFEVWPRWATASLLIAGTLALISRIFFADLAFMLPWLCLTPLLATVPAIFYCVRRAYRPAEIAAIADSLSGGHGTLLTVFETGAQSWSGLASFPMPRLRPWRKLTPVLAAALFLAVTILMPQRMPAATGRTILANNVVADLKSTVEQLKQQELITPEESKSLEEEVERIRRDALDRVDSSTWEAADALREKMAAGLSQKEDAMQWAEDSLARFAAAAQAGNAPTPAETEELANAIGKLLETGMLSDAPADLQKLLGGEKGMSAGRISLPKDPAQLRRLAESLAEHLGNRAARLGQIRQLPRESGRFDPAEFGEFNFNAEEGNGNPGSGGLGRGRADAELTWGDESLPFDRFKSVALPPGAVRSPDDWSPVAMLPGAPKESTEKSEASSGMQFAGTAGQAAWRRTLAPRHYSAVKRYFENSQSR